MARLPEPLDSTLEAADREMERRAAAEPRRDYLGASIVGHPCSRFVWYSIRPEYPRTPFNAATLKRFADGHAGEAVVIERLKAAPGVELWEADPATGNQWGFTDHGGRFRGHLDGVIRGIYQAPKTAHVFECKITNSKKFEEFRKLKRDLGEKFTLRNWDQTYYVQAMIYCFYYGLTRHYTVVATPGVREWDSCRTDADPETAQQYIRLAKHLLDSEEPPPRISERKEHWKCKWCDFADVCHAGPAC